MFQREKIDYLYRLLCLLSFLIVVLFINSSVTVIIITIAFYVLTMFERRFENVFLYVVTGIIFIICLAMKNYLLLRLITCIDYIHYFLNNEMLDDYEEIEDDDIIIKNKERDTDNNMLCTVFVLVHLLLLLLAIMVG